MKSCAIKIIGEAIIEQPIIAQLKQSIQYASYAACMPNAQRGNSQPIGSVIAYKDHVSISGIGYDIGCGNLAICTNLKASSLPIKTIMKEIYGTFVLGIGKRTSKEAFEKAIHLIEQSNFKPQRSFVKIVKAEFGTIGKGDHYIDLLKDVQDRLWIAIHFGSLSIGSKTTAGFLSLLQGGCFNSAAKELALDSPPVLLNVHSTLMDDYKEAMNVAVQYASHARTSVADRILEILGAKKTQEVHSCHNIASQETHFGETFWVIRKGCPASFPQQKNFIGSNMRDYSVIVEAMDSSLAKQSLYSAMQGSGRIAIDKRKKIIDFSAILYQLKREKIELQGSSVNYSPDLYKYLWQTLSLMQESLHVAHRLFPIGVAMHS